MSVDVSLIENEKRARCLVRMRKANIPSSMADMQYDEICGRFFLETIAPGGPLSSKTFFMFDIESIGGKIPIGHFMRSIARIDANFCGVFYVNLSNGFDVDFEVYDYSGNYTGNFSHFGGFLFLVYEHELTKEESCELLKILLRRVEGCQPTIIFTKKDLLRRLSEANKSSFEEVKKSFKSVGL